MGEKCVRDELRTLFLFETLSDEQLDDALREMGTSRLFEPGPVCTRVTRRPASTS